MTQVATSPETYAAQFARFKQGAVFSGPLASLRDDAFLCFDRLGFPTTRLEDWRFTNVAPIAETPFLAQTESVDYTRAALDGLNLPRIGGPELVFVNGLFNPGLSSTAGLPAGVRVRSLAAVLADEPEAVTPHLGRLARVEVPAGVVVQVPIQLQFVTSSGVAPVLSLPRVLVLAGADSQVTVVESHTGTAATPYLSNAVTEVSVGDNAVVDHYSVVREADVAFRVGSLHAHLGRASNFSSHTITLGGAIVRNEAQVVLGGEGGVCTLNGLYLANDRQLVDNQTTIDHAQPHCDSHELYKGILAGRSRGVFNGKIIVRLDAQKTDAKQSNKALLLSEDAQITSKPQLEIFADDVKCTHGATVGQLDSESLFYLRSRGLSKEQARQLLVHAFAADLLRHIRVAEVRAQLDDQLLERLPVGDVGL